MTDSNIATPATANKPSHIAYQVRDVDGGKGFWTRIGSAWKHADGNGLSIQLDCVPLNGRISLRTNTEKSGTEKSE